MCGDVPDVLEEEAGIERSRLFGSDQGWGSEDVTGHGYRSGLASMCIFLCTYIAR